MGMMEGGPDLIFNRGRDDATVPWKRLIVGAILTAWGLFVVVPFIFAEDASSTMLIRWTIIALIAVVLTLILTPLLSRDQRGAAVGVVLAAVTTIVVAWISTT